MENIPHSRPWLTDAEAASAGQVIASKMIAAGQLNAEFERQVATRLGMGAARSFPSGAVALREALLIAGVTVGGEVIVPTYVCRSVADAVNSVGAVPVYSDVNENGCISVEEAAKRISTATQAIVAVHIFGHACAVRALEALGVPVIEDACQAFGFEMAEGFSGGIGNISVLSFHATKCLTTGEGGMLLVRQPDGLDEHASLEPPLSDLQCAVGLQQLARYEEFLSRRREIAARYDAAASSRGAILQRAQPKARDLFRYVLSSTRMFEEIAHIFARDGIQTRRGVDALLHRQAGQSDDAFPVATRLFAQSISLPFYPSLREHQVNRIVQTLETLTA